MIKHITDLKINRMNNFRIILVISLSLMTFGKMMSQDLIALSPINYPKIERELVNGYTVYTNYNIKISKEKEIYVGDDLVYKCEFPEYYEYLIELYKGERNFLLVSPLSRTNYGGVATPYNIDRGLLLVFDYETGKKYYASLDSIKRIQIPEAFNHAKNQSHAFMIESIDVVKSKIKVLQGGVEVSEVYIDMYQF